MEIPQGKNVSIGIDLGTTYCCVMYVDDESQVQIIPSFDGDDLTPSAIYINDQDVSVGQWAKTQGVDDPDNLITGIKRNMGKELPLTYHGQTFTPEGLSGVILTRLLEDAKNYFKLPAENIHAVITIPAYFGVAEREATYAAARIAGLDCMQLLPEPVAAAYSYDFDSQNQGSSLVFDLGGGTFDVAAVSVNGNDFQVWGVDGETQLGGLDWDRALSDVMWEKLLDAGIDDEAEYDDAFYANLLLQAENVKKNLNVKDSVSFRIRYGKETYSAQVSKEEFRQASIGLTHQCIEASKRIIEKSHSLPMPPITQILLVGGSTRMAILKEALEKSLDLPVQIHDPDKAVARGAAKYARRLWAQKRFEAMQKTNPARLQMVAFPGGKIQNVSAKTIGIKVMSSNLPTLGKEYILSILPANTPLPAQKTITVATVARNQEKVRIELYEQSGIVFSQDLSANTKIFDAEIEVQGIQEAGSPINVEVSLDEASRISIQARQGNHVGSLKMQAFMEGVIDESELKLQRSNVMGLRLEK